MLLPPKVAHGVADGSVTLAFRRWQKPHVRPGGRYRCHPIGVIEVDAIERAVLRIAAYELRQRRDVPYRVVINEAIETVKRFGAEHGHTYVNGVLDHAAAAWRAVEVQAARPR